MSNVIGNQDSFGRSANQAQSPAALLDLELRAGKIELFREIDALLGDLIVRVLRGERVVELLLDRAAGNTVAVHDLTPAQRALLGSTYDVSSQQARGAWYLPDEVALRVGIINLPFDFRTYGRFAINIASEERGGVQLADNPAAILVWSVLEPLFGHLFLPFELRGAQTAAKSREEQLQSWAEIDRFFSALGISVSTELAVMRYGGGWHRLRSAEQLETKLRLLSALAEQAHSGMGSLYRAYRTQELLTNYYKKAKNGQARRKQALTKALERTLSGFFAGDWLAFLAYIGEDPHPDEQVIQALPTPHLYATGASRAAEVAAKLGIPAEEAERIAAVYWGEGGGKTPIERRVAVFARFWQLFDEIHSRQEPGMKPLWGLVEDYTTLDLRDIQVESPYQAGLYRELLPPELVTEIEDLWGTTMLQRWPESIVTQAYPHNAMAEVFGPALRFWQGAALTAWFLCEGPYSRTDMAGLAKYHASQIAELKAHGTPIDERIFQELVKAEKSLGPAEPIIDKQDTIKGAQGISITVTMSHGGRRRGFEMLRDIITHYRRTWASQYLEKYIRARWELELKEAHRTYNIALQERGKAPTAKQFAKSALSATNHWFGGDISGLYAAIGEKCPVEPRRRTVLPSDPRSFALRVLHELQEHARGTNPNPPLREGDGRFENMAGMCLTYIQLEEALGSPPRRQEFTSLNNDYYWSVLANDLDEAMVVYTQAIEEAKRYVSAPDQAANQAYGSRGAPPSIPPAVAAATVAIKSSQTLAAPTAARAPLPLPESTRQPLLQAHAPTQPLAEHQTLEGDPRQGENKQRGRRSLLDRVLGRNK